MGTKHKLTNLLTNLLTITSKALFVDEFIFNFFSRLVQMQTMPKALQEPKHPQDASSVRLRQVQVARLPHVRVQLQKKVQFEATFEI